MKIRIDPDGRLQCLESPELEHLDLRQLGPVQAPRASQVELEADGWWITLLPPFTAQRFGPFWPRAKALEVEHRIVEQLLFAKEF